jgi:hypothetical protein
MDAAIKFCISGADLKETKRIIEKSTATKKDTPPNVGMGVKWTFLSEGWSNNFFASAILITTGVVKKATKKESNDAKTTISMTCFSTDTKSDQRSTIKRIFQRVILQEYQDKKRPEKEKKHQIH